jgi:hypothetical protein
MKYEYEYKTIAIGKDDPIGDSDLEALNDLYSDGWKFVSASPQVVTHGGGSFGSTRYAPIIFTLKKFNMLDPYESKN